MSAQAKTTADKSAARREQAAALHESITAKVAQLTDTDAWAAYLTAAAAFHSYSFNNVMLIFSQAPDASQVAGFRKWQALGRQVRKGEKSIKIFGYSTKKITETDTETGEETTRRAARFPILSVFDIAQTDPIEGHPAAAADTITTRLEGEDPAAIYTRIADVMIEQGWTVTREHIAGESNGRTSLDGSRRIIVDDTISDAQAAKTMIHEAAHALMHASGATEKTNTRWAAEHDEILREHFPAAIAVAERTEDPRWNAAVGRIRELVTHASFDVDDLCRKIETVAHSTAHVTGITDALDTIAPPAREPVDPAAPHWVHSPRPRRPPRRPRTRRAAGDHLHRRRSRTHREHPTHQHRRPAEQRP